MTTRTELSLTAAHEWVAHDPFGNTKPGDASPRDEAAGAQDRVSLRAARGGYVSFRTLVHGTGEYAVSVDLEGPLQVDLFKAWYHRMHSDGDGPPVYWPDALIPVPGDATHRIPDAENMIDGQTVHEFWVDVYVPKDAPVGLASGLVRLTGAGADAALPVTVEVLGTVLPDEPCIAIDHNSYGCRNLERWYPDLYGRARPQGRHWDASIDLLHQYYRLVHEHRGVFHNLGYGHSGACDPIYAPRMRGAGRDKDLVDWGLFDRHYGPLLDGSAFATPPAGMSSARRGATPIWGVYTPINPDWPASYLWWGQKGYEVEFTRCVSQLDAHLRELGGTGTRVEFFLNHKKRYRWFEWDGDEPKYAKDMSYHEEMIRMWESAVAGSPVDWVYRMDASWQMKNQFARLGAHRNFWVCGGFHTWYPHELADVRERGETVWWYGGTPPVDAPSTAILSLVYETWGRDLQGNCQWLTNDPGPDPWFDCNGASTGTMYPGERFGVPGPIPSARLKILRNGIQDIDLLDRAATRSQTSAQVRRELSASVPIPLWTDPPRAAVELPPEDWDSHNLSQEHEPVHAGRELDPRWWNEIQARALPSAMR